jgi:8-oxo-dGTP pyrophosphatase MutT (NUDIX family)
MYVTFEMIAEWEENYGRPVHRTLDQTVSPEEYAIIAGSQKDGRAHDITLYIAHEGKIAVIAKPFYPPSLYRAPSGGLNPGESLEEGAQREAREETGLEISLTHYLLRTNVRFHEGDNTIDWQSHVFAAEAISAELAPTDTEEIREARWAAPEDFDGFCTLKRESGNGGLNYRAILHEHVARLHPVFSEPDEEPVTEPVTEPVSEPAAE